ncbi:hypothetical protein Psch_03905 [Pelotomaculum schinkii]|uniref:Peptidase C39-like domain-containing protein n=1 Tax=Pelotomaculum schinkii TaxID=78350 RepID=A0A4Y7R6E1_9FIRM|nr:hypothetical protein [Pelotomaculum schinkii]TEB04180.1 hypothetical protein Psch_03905 [Pelotomaculum schinkii]
MEKNLLAEENSISALEAKRAVVFQIVMDMKSFNHTPWSNKAVKIQNPIEVYDASDSLYSYLFNLSVDGKAAGFIEVSAMRDEYPVLSFAREGSAMDQLQMEKLQQNVKKPPENKKVVLAGPAHFALKVDYADGSADVMTSLETFSLSKEKNKPVPKKGMDRNDHARELRQNIDAITREIGTIDDGVTDDLGFETGSNSYANYDGVPDLNQFLNPLWVGFSGCSPTSAANIMKYWSTHGYPALTQGMSDAQLLYELRLAMGTDNNGATSVNSIAPGMKSFALSRGVSAARAYYLPGTPPSWSTYKSYLNSFDPNVITLDTHTYYNEGDKRRSHSVTGVGWTEFFYNGSSTGHQYMEVHDNDFDTPMTVYVAYNQNYYEAIYFDQFSPAGLAIGKYILTPVTNSYYTKGKTADGINTMTVNSGVQGLKYFTVTSAPVIEHRGTETVIFTQLRDGTQIGMNTTVADFDVVQTASAGFNVQSGDVIRVFIVDFLTNEPDFNPSLLE